MKTGGYNGRMQKTAFLSSFVPHRYLTVAVLTVALLSIGLCSQEEPPPEITVRGANIIGDWAVDVEAMEDSLGCNPLQRLGLELYKDMKMRITHDTLTVKLTLLGESKEFSGKYRVLGAEGNVVRVEALSGKEKGVVSTIEFLTHDRIRLSKNDGKDEPPLIMVRQ